MKRLRNVLTCAGLGIGLLAASAQALPPALERVPDDAMVAIAIADPVKLQSNVQALSKAIGQPLPAEMGVKELLGMGGFTGGVDGTKSIAVVIMAPDQKKAGAKPDDENPMAEMADMEQRTLMLLPITSYEELLKGFDVKPAGAGKVDAIALPTGEDGFVKDIGGGYAVFGSSRELVEAFSGKPGDKPFKSRMGKAGNALADSSDIVTLINVAAVRPMAEEGIKEMKKAAQAQLEGMGQDAEAQMAFVNWMTETVVRDTDFAVGGIKISDGGLAMDMLGTFKADSYLAKAFAVSGNTQGLLAKLPAQPFLWAGALDTSSAGIKTLLRDITSKSALPGGDEAAKVAATAVAEADGQAAVIGLPVGGIIGGLLTSTVSFTQAKDPNAAAKSIKDSLMVMDKKTLQGMTYASTYVENAAKAGDVSLDSWDMKITPDGSNQMGMQSLAMIFGPTGGPSGYIAKVDGGIYRSYAKNTDLMSKAIAAGKGGESVVADAQLKDVQSRLPAKRVAEAYIGSKSVMDMVLPFAAMAGVPVPAGAVPDKLAPIGLAVSSDEGSARASVFVPAGVIKTAAALAEGVQQMQQGGEEGGEMAPNDGKKRDGAGQPKF